MPHPSLMVEAFFAQINMVPLTPAVVETLEAQLYGSMESKTTRFTVYFFFIYGATLVSYH